MSNRHRFRRTSALATGIGCLAFVQPTIADDLYANLFQDQAASSSEWRFEIAPYLWAISLDGDAALLGGPGFEIDAPFTDTVDKSDTLIGLMGHFEVGRDKWSIFFEPAYTKIGVEGILTDGGPGNLEITSGWYEFGGAWRLLDNPRDGDESLRCTLDLLGGVRFTDLEVDLDIDGGGGRDGDESWAEPFIGARSSIDLSENFVLRLRGDVGGFGIGSDFAWQLAGVVGWNFNLFGADATLFAGYRALSQDYDDGPFEWDVTAHGPIFGLGFTF